MSQHPYSRAQRVFLITDNGSAHRGKRSIDRLQGTFQWKFTRHDLHKLLAKTDTTQPTTLAA